MSDLEGRMSFASPTAGRAAPEAYDIHQAGSKPLQTQGRAGYPAARGKLPPSASDGTGPLAGYRPRPIVEQGRVGAPGSLPSPTEVEEHDFAEAHSAEAARGVHYVPRPTVQEGRVGTPGSLPTPMQVERSQRMARATPGSKSNEYTGRPDSDMGRAIPGAPPARSSGSAYAAPGSQYTARPNAELGRASMSGNQRKPAPTEAPKSGTQHLGRASALPAPPPPPRAVSRPAELGRVGASANPSGTVASDPNKRSKGDLTNTGRVRSQAPAPAAPGPAPKAAGSAAPAANSAPNPGATGAVQPIAGK